MITYKKEKNKVFISNDCGIPVLVAIKPSDPNEQIKVYFDDSILLDRINNEPLTMFIMPDREKFTVESNGCFEVLVFNTTWEFLNFKDESVLYSKSINKIKKGIKC